MKILLPSHDPFTKANFPSLEKPFTSNTHVILHIAYKSLSLLLREKLDNKYGLGECEEGRKRFALTRENGRQCCRLSREDTERP